ncbi:hypothetical protein CYY_009821, partial [Polysphondylium violaceum]
VQGQIKSFSHKNELMIGFFIISLVKEYFIEFNQSYLYNHYIKIHEQISFSSQSSQAYPSSATSTPLFTTKKQKLNNGTTIISNAPDQQVSLSAATNIEFDSAVAASSRNKPSIQSLESYFDHLCQLIDNLK